MSMNKGDPLVTGLTCSEGQWTARTDRIARTPQSSCMFGGRFILCEQT